VKVFIGGSRNINRLNDEIRNRLHNIVKQGFEVLVGDANGADKAVQKYFLESKYNSLVVYCSGETCRNNLGSWKTTKVETPMGAHGLKFYMVKDHRMAIDADYGFMLWDGKSAGTLNNMLNLIKQNKKLLIYFSPKKEFYTISSTEDLQKILTLCAHDSLAKIDKKISYSNIIKEISRPKQIQLSL